MQSENDIETSGLTKTFKSKRGVMNGNWLSRRKENRNRDSC
jgi:hypothetical protein